MTAPKLSAALNPTHHSTSFELMIETSFLADLLQEMWFARCQLVDVLHSTADAFGYDLVLQSGKVTRHVQLKTRKSTGKTASFKINAQLYDQPAACVVLIEWDEPDCDARLRLHYRWFGGGPQEKIPDLGQKFAKPTKGNAQGVKGVREGLRVVLRGKFAPVDDMAELTIRLFGSAGD